MSERKLARVVRIDEVKTHPNADALDLVMIGGWQCVVKRGEYRTGDLAIYLEVDSWVPHTIAPYLTKPGHEPKVYNGVAGQKLRTIRLRGELSQGLILPVNNWLGFTSIKDISGETVAVNEGDDVTVILGIQKWEAPVNAQLAGQTKGSFPNQFPKTDQERIQNLTRQLEKWKEDGLTFTVQEKLEGSSMTCYLLNGEFGVCSRNLDLKETEGNTFWQVARELNIEENMRKTFLGEDVAIQCELIGPGIQGNIYKLSKPTARMFDVVFAQGMKYASPILMQDLAKEMNMQTVPVIGQFNISDDCTVQDILQMAEGKSVLNQNQEREGLVFKCNEDPSITFKAISNRYLLKQEE